MLKGNKIPSNRSATMPAVSAAAKGASGTPQVGSAVRPVGAVPIAAAGAKEVVMVGIVTQTRP